MINLAPAGLLWPLSWLPISHRTPQVGIRDYFTKHGGRKVNLIKLDTLVLRVAAGLKVNNKHSLRAGVVMKKITVFSYHCVVPREVPKGVI